MIVMRIAAALLTTWAMLWIATGDSYALVRAGVALAPFVLGFSIVLACLSVALRDRPSLALSSLVAGLIAIHLPASVLRLSNATGDDGISLTTLSNRTKNTDMAATAAMLRANRADIFALQEISDPMALITRLNGLYGPGAAMHSCRHKTYLAISRYRFGAPEVLPNTVAVRCPIDLPNGPAQLYLVHLPRAVVTADRQDAAVVDLLGHIARQADPVIVAGDFNATPLSSTMQAFNKELINAFDATGRGIGFTFPTGARRLGALGPFLRIDHVLVTSQLSPRAARAARWHPPGADHFPVEIVFIDRRDMAIHKAASHD